MSNSKLELLSVISNTLKSTGFVATPGARRKVAEAILKDLFYSNRWDAVQGYLNERVDEELPDRFDPRDVSILGGDPSL